MNDRVERLYGRGVRFPLVREPGLGWVTGEDAVSQALRSLLLTEPGERIGRPSYGAGLSRFLFAPTNLSTRSLIRETVVEAIERDEPRVELEAVRVAADPVEPGLLQIDIEYRLIGESTSRNLVFPFYLDQGVA